jgi:O-antigen ligase
MTEILLLNQSRTHIFVALGLGMLLGLGSVLLSPLLMLTGLVGLGFLILLVKRPEIGLLIHIVITSTLINETNLPKIPIGVGRILITDLILLALIGLIIVRALTDHDFKIVHTPLDLPLLGFLGIAFLSTFIAINQSRLTISDSLGEIRVITGYLTFFVVTNLVREERQLRDLLRGLLFLATGVAFAMIAQFLLGSHVQILPGRVETLGTEGVSFMGVTRIIPPGESLVFTAFLATTVSIIIDKLTLQKAGVIVAWGLTGFGVVLTFKRNLWIAICLGILLLAIVSGLRNRLKIAGGILIVILAAALLLSPIFSQSGSEASKLVTGAFNRLTSLTKPNTFEDPDSSLRWRDFEYQYAIPQIVSHPLIGLGQGARYRPFVIGKDWKLFDGRGFIHNGYLSIIVKSGLLGFLSLLAFSLIVLVHGFKFWARIPNLQFQAILLGFTLAYLGILIGSVVSPMIVTGWWTPIIGIIVGINEVILSKGVTKNMEVPAS